MAAEDIPKALAPFGQIEKKVRRKQEGTGLGLPLAKQLVELHGGTFAIESAINVGTTVTFLLPASRLVASTAGLSAARAG
jgi:signal transduction histidine kinase